MRIYPIADGVFGVDSDIKLPGGVKLPLRMTITQTSEGLVLISPLPIDDGLAAELDELGPVVGLIGPNLLHHLYLGPAKERYPDARLIGAPGLEQKRSDLCFDGNAGNPHWPELEPLMIAGLPKLNEVLFLHQPSRTLIVTDLVFNIPDASGMSWVVLKLVSRALGKVEQSRLIRSYTKDRSAAKRSLEALFALSFDRVVVAHGDVVNHNAKETLHAATWWMRGQKQRVNLGDAPIL